MHDLNDLYYFVQVVDLGGFAPAGRALGEPNPNSAGASPCWSSAWAYG